MARRGRPQLHGKRKNGRRVLASAWDHGADHAIASRALFVRFQDGKADQQVYDSIGRAWAVGLLENDQVDPAALRDAGRKYALRYWGHYPSAPGVANYEQDVRRGPTAIDGADPSGERFNALDRLLLNAGRASYRAVQCVCVDFHWTPDANPAWLGRLINARLHEKPSRSDDIRQMQIALGGLLALAGERIAA